MSSRPRPCSRPRSRLALTLALLSLALAVLCLPRAARADYEPPTLWLGDNVQLRPSVQYRPRFYANSGQDFAPGNNLSFVEHRARVGVELRYSYWVAGLVEVWDVRIWGEEGSLIGDDRADGIDIRRAWVDLHTRDGKVRLRAGRWSLRLDNLRMFHYAEWNSRRRVFDGARLDFVGKRVEGKIFWMQIANEDTTLLDPPALGQGSSGPARDVMLLGGWMRFKRRLSLLVLLDRIDHEDTTRVTFGGYYRHKPARGLQFEGDFYWQTGRAGDGKTRQHIAAFLFGARLGWRFGGRSKLEVNARIDYLSGDNDNGDGVLRTVDTRFNAGHFHYGLMDYFLNPASNTRGHGLVDGGLTVKVKPLAKLALMVQYHHFRFAQPWLEGGGSRETFTLGNELDFVATVRLHRYFSIQGGVGAFRPERGITCVRGPGGCRDGAPTEYFSYLYLDVNIR